MKKDYGHFCSQKKYYGEVGYGYGKRNSRYSKALVHKKEEKMVSTRASMVIEQCIGKRKAENVGYLDKEIKELTTPKVCGDNYLQRCSKRRRDKGVVHDNDDGGVAHDDDNRGLAMEERMSTKRVGLSYFSSMVRSEK
ncbi:hypothetical protein VNO78_34047 [Psophocarpus tetragonolobus]|uniref:Uncharacterized protein n=1 Tax=Psophocarpus tetragonolobus TaxID=3891 RepID=A0AAN9RSC4_PSOTE